MRRRGLVMTTVWLFEPRSHGRRKAATRAHNGAPLSGWRPISHLPHRSASPALCPCGHAASFRRRASSFVRGAWRSVALLPVAVLCVCARCVRRAGRRARAWCCPVAAAAAAAACALRLSRCRACLPWRVRARWLRGVRAGCQGGVRFVSCPSCGRGVASLLERRACAPPVPVLGMSLMPPQVVGAVAAAMSPLC